MAPITPRRAATAAVMVLVVGYGAAGAPAPSLDVGGGGSVAVQTATPTPTATEAVETATPSTETETPTSTPTAAPTTDSGGGSVSVESTETPTPTPTPEPTPEPFDAAAVGVADAAVTVDDTFAGEGERWVVSVTFENANEAAASVSFAWFLVWDADEPTVVDRPGDDWNQHGVSDYGRPRAVSVSAGGSATAEYAIDNPDLGAGTWQAETASVVVDIEAIHEG